MPQSGPDATVAALRILRQTLSDIILPEVTSAHARNAAGLCDLVLVRMIVALEDQPGIDAAHEARLGSLLMQADYGAGGASADAGAALGVRVQSAVRDLQARLARPARGAEPDQARSADILSLLARIAAADAAWRDDVEDACARTAARDAPVAAGLEMNSDRLQAYFDQRLGPGTIRLRRFQQIPGGRSKRTVLLTVEPNTLLPGEMVLRIDVPGSAVATTVGDEFPILQGMYRSGVAAPEPVWMERDGAVLGAPFMLMRRMPGAEAGDLWGAKPVSPAIVRDLAQALASVHRADVAPLWPAAPARAGEAVAAMIARYEQSWRAGAAASSSVLEAAYGWLARHQPCIDGPTVALHGDVHFANILVEDDRLICLLDWEFAHPGHPADDLAYCRPYVEASMDWADFLAHYRACGGPAVTAEQLRFFGVWGTLRNATMGVNMLRDVAGGTVHGIQNLAIALNTRARLEALLARALAAAMCHDAGA